jgi:hypothetical protein
MIVEKSPFIERLGASRQGHFGPIVIIRETQWIALWHP